MNDKQKRILSITLLVIIAISCLVGLLICL